MLECRLTPAAFTWNPENGSTNGSLATNWISDDTGLRLVAGQDAAPGADDDLYFRAITVATSPPPPPTSPPPGGPGGGVVVVNENGEPYTPVSPPASPPPPPASPPASPPAPTTVSPNCTLGTAGSSNPINFAGIHVMSGYTGTLTLASQSTTVAEYQQFDGFLVQVAGVSGSSLNTLTVTDVFEWTGGSLNDTEDEGVVRLDAATGVIDPGENKTVSTANTFTLDGSDLSFFEGTWALTGGTGIDVNDDSTFNIGGDGEEGEGQPGDLPPLPNFPPIPVKSILVAPPNDPFVEAEEKVIRVFAGGKVYATPPKQSNWIHEVTVTPLIRNDGGVVDIGESVDIAFKASHQEMVAGNNVATSFLQNSGTFNLAHTSIARFDETLVLRSGKLATTSRDVAPQGGLKSVKEARIVGNVLSYADIFILQNQQDVFGNLKIEGDLDWRAGELNVKLDGSSPAAGVPNLMTALEVTQKIKVDTGTAENRKAKIKVAAISGLPPLTAPAAGRKWEKFVTAGTQITLQANGAVSRLTTGTGYHVEEVGADVVKEWNLVVND